MILLTNIFILSLFFVLEEIAAINLTKFRKVQTELGQLINLKEFILFYFIF